uniref:SagB-type dehydrogenase domain-containing protein n=1 Tax=Candidatus Kentrum sp. TUN TaxID=2126343 RepID=A0A450ZQ69_9GAMM|nr:MAG: SagB-type dehydrogenase domain-containing protein [Candidatus Kentron sp. TUN]VFK53961.1 MAG: SagB-type dehydrogenase domain-containing protein [Candidatus Kentron sp. TUN]VFK55979.1 MAG: SagB-type dehydrogenase domain-containing protein [Candidatus Kentron sp. TUN]
MNNREIIRDYHEATKHHFRRYAKSLGYLDWAIQPNPFREFTGTQFIALPLQERDESARYEDIFVSGKIPATELSQESIGKFFEYSLAISAWKQSGASQWALRINPSSGNLHPTEGYCILPALNGINRFPSVYHYAPEKHGLEIRAEFSQKTWALLPPDIFLVGLSSISWREAWKYGERAFRYCQHDCGHAYMALDVATRMLGWRISLLHTVSDQEISAALGLDRSREFNSNEEEIPELLIAVQLKPQDKTAQYTIPDDFFPGILDGKWFGTANTLSESHHDWPLIRLAAQATRKPKTIEKLPDDSISESDRKTTPENYSLDYEQGLSAYQVIKKRRSAVSMDAVTTLAERAFYRILLRVAASRQNLPWSPKIHLALFVHRIDSLAPGLYMLVRDPAAYVELKEITHQHFHWEKPSGCPANLELYLLQAGDLTDIAKTISCTQDIAGDSAFSLGMIARFQPSIETHGAWFYKRILWESGMIGQILYLEAEAFGLSGTGIGCFFDDAVHDMLGFSGTDFQSVYHFTVGGALVDPRLVTLPAYTR